MSSDSRPGRRRAPATTTGRARRGVEPRSALQAARMRRDWSQPRAVDTMLRIARRLNITMASPASLKSELSRWENGQVPDAPWRRIFREMYGLTDAELGFADDATADNLADTVDAGLSELAGRLRSAERVDGELIDVLGAQTHHLRLLDRRFGGAVLLDQMSSHVESVSGLLTHSVRGPDREALARVLADAGALAGWQALDTGAVQRAWTHFTVARTAATEAQRPALLAHALGEQAYALLELGRASSAAQLIDVAAGTKGLPPLLRAWLAAAKGEMLAAAGDSGAQALRAFDAAHALLPDEPHDEPLPFLALDEVHLARWRGNALARLGRADAIDQLTAALARLDPLFVRAACTVHTDLAVAYAAAGEREQAVAEARTARQLAIQIGSERIRRRLAQLRLPDTPGGEQR